MCYLKHEQQCFIRYKDTRRSRVSLGLIKHALRIAFKSIASKNDRDKTRTANCFQIDCFKNDRSSKFIGEVIFKRYVV